MQRTPVESSMLRSVGYDLATRTLEVEFQTGRVYQYEEVAPDVHRRLMEASSLGSHFNAMIRDAFPCWEVYQARRRRPR